VDGDLMAQHESRFTVNTKSRSESGGVSWTLCESAGCPGEAVPNRPYCLIHLSDDARRDYLLGVAAGNQPLTLSGLSVSGLLLSVVIGAMPTTTENPSGSPRPLFPTPVRFNETTFLEYVDAQHVTFADTCSLLNATFQAGAIWNGSVFNGGLDMRGCHIYGDRAKFSNVRVRRRADLAALVCQPFLVLFGLIVEGPLDMRAAKCGGLWLSNASLTGEVKLEGARLAEQFQDADGPRRKLLGRFDGCKFHDSVDFSDVHFPYETTFGGYSDMRPAEFSGPVNFSESQFGSKADGGRHLLRNLAFDPYSVDFTGCTFYGRVSFSGTRFGAPLRLVNVTVRAGSTDASKDQDPNDQFPEYPALELTDLSLPSGGELTNIDVQGDVTLKLSSLEADFGTRSVRATGDVNISSTQCSQYATSEMAGTTVSYSRCQFARGGVLTCSTQRLSVVECDARQPLTITAMTGAAAVPISTLDRTNAEHLLLSNVDLSTTSFAGIINLDKLRIQGRLRLQRAPTVVGRGRQVIQDEINVRRTHSSIWRRFRASSDMPQTQSPQDVASLYRALRKNREDSKDEPGGADFYYGEMEMRRLAAPWTSVDRWLLTIYWLLSGYALRAWRALVALIGVVLILGYFLCRHGFNPNLQRDYVQSVLLLAQTSVGLSRASPSELTSIGSAIQIAMRIMGPALLALVVLALRGRVKR
jgi:hypothetical protein